jgi:hypothetical protein
MNKRINNLITIETEGDMALLFQVITPSIKTDNLEYETEKQVCLLVEGETCLDDVIQSINISMPVFVTRKGAMQLLAALSCFIDSFKEEDERENP